ncbi:MAG: hypothetical protein ACKOEH_03290 [Actinomycetota bacterium]
MTSQGEVLAELEIWHTRPFTPTRRLSLGSLIVPVEQSPGLGGVLLGGVVAKHFGEVDDEIVPDIHRLLAQVERGERVVQPRLRHRLQTDRHGLAKSVHRLRGDKSELVVDFESNGSDLLQVLGSIYALERLEESSRRSLSLVIGRAMRWRGPLDQTFIAFLAGSAVTNISAMADPRAWALELLGFPAGTVKPSKRQVQERYRAVLRTVHPDHGGDAATASKSIEEIGEARRVLLHS